MKPMTTPTNTDTPMTIDQSKIVPIEQETDIKRLRQLATDYKENYNWQFNKTQELERELAQAIRERDALSLRQLQQADLIESYTQEGTRQRLRIAELESSLESSHRAYVHEGNLVVAAKTERDSARYDAFTEAAEIVDQYDQIIDPRPTPKKIITAIIATRDNKKENV